jgi:HSP20 family protein
MWVRTFETVDDLFDRLESDLTGLFGRTRMGSSAPEGRMIPRMEILRTSSEFVVRAELPGVDPDSVDVTLEDTTLRIRAERRVPATEQGEYLRRELVYGTFEGTIKLPSGVDPEKLSARYDAGILEVRVPLEAPQASKIPVEIGPGQTNALEAAS